MAKIHNYIVSFNPAEKTDYGFTVTFEMSKPNVNHRVSADNFVALEAEVRRLAHEYGRTCSPYVRLADRNARKPAGFDKWSGALKVIEYVAPPAESEAA